MYMHIHTGTCILHTCTCTCMYIHIHALLYMYVQFNVLSKFAKQSYTLITITTQKVILMKIHEHHWCILLWFLLCICIRICLYAYNRQIWLTWWLPPWAAAAPVQRAVSPKPSADAVAPESDNDLQNFAGDFAGLSLSTCRQPWFYQLLLLRACTLPHRAACLSASKKAIIIMSGVMKSGRKSTKNEYFCYKTSFGYVPPRKLTHDEFVHKLPRHATVGHSMVVLVYMMRDMMIHWSCVRLDCDRQAWNFYVTAAFCCDESDCALAHMRECIIGEEKRTVFTRRTTFLW